MTRKTNRSPGTKPPRITQIHVAADGHDRSPGSEKEPLATPHGALAAIRRLKKRSEPGPIQIILHAGTYHLARTLTFTPRDSGSADAPVTFRAATGEKVVFSGGRRIEGWRISKINRRICWTCDLPDVRDGNWNFTQLFVNGCRRPRTRLPKTGWYRFKDYVVASDQTPKWYHGPRRMHYYAGDLKRWKNMGDIRLIAPEYWFVSHHRIRQVDTKRRIVHFKKHSVASLSDEKQKCARYVVENVFEALQDPGQWYLDRKAGKLYYIPLPGETPESVEIIAPLLDRIVEFAGSAARPVKHIHLENLSLHHAEWQYPDDNPGSVQAACRVPGAIVMRGAQHCVLYGCEVAHVATYGIETRNGCHENRVVHCAIHDTGAGGVKIGHEWMPRVDETSTHVIRRSTPLPSATTVSDCRVHDVGKIYFDAAGIWIGNAGGNRIVHNEIFNTRYTGISCGWTWGYAPTATIDNRIEDNHIHHIAWDRVLSDNGGIYTLGTMPGCTIRRNHIHHVGCYGYGGTGIYLDEGASEVQVEDNIVHHTTNAGCFVHVGRDLLVRNNIFAMAQTQHVRPGNRGESRSIVYTHNITYWREGQLERTSWGLQRCEWALKHYRLANNVFFNAAGEVVFGGEHTFEQLQAVGQHANTWIADPLFADPEAGDFTLREDSPAFSLDFTPIDLSDVGPRQAGKRPVDHADLPAEGLHPRPVVRTHIERDGSRGIRVRLENVGRVVASGRLLLAAEPAAAVSFKGKRSIQFKDLAPGASQDESVQIRIRGDVETVTIESLPRSPCLVPMMLHINP
jgi:hypothetical protein